MSGCGRLAHLTDGPARVAGRHFVNPEVEFAGAFSDIYAAGNIGPNFLCTFNIVFDYGNKRVAFAPASRRRG